MTVDIGTDFDWTDSVYKEERKTQIEGRDWVEKIWSEQEKAISEQASVSVKLVISFQRNREGYDVDQMSKEQQDIVYTAVDTIIKFLNNDPSYKPMCATIMGSGGTGKSFVINAIIGMVRKLTSCNDTVQIGAPSGAAAFSVQGSTIHSLLRVRVNNPEKPLTASTKARLLDQLERLLVLIIDERSMIR